MNTFVKVTFAVGVPMMVLLGMSDLAATFYRPDPAGQLGYQVVEPEIVEEEVIEEAPVEDAAVEQEPAAEDVAATEEEPAAEDVAEATTEEEMDVAEAPVEEAPAEEVVAEQAPSEEEAAEEVAEAETVTEESGVAEDSTTEEVAESDQTSTEEVAQADTAVSEVGEATEDSTTEEVATTEEAAAPTMIALSDDEMRQAERAMRKCTTCHQIDRERNAAGPHLVGVVGRAIGSIDGFRYSDALTSLGDAGEVWNVENLQAWIENPAEFADGSRMNFKVGDEEERRLIAGWLAAQ